jgi:hypothetical protein
MKIKLLAVTMCFVGFTTYVHAADQSSGCGMGWYVTQRNSLLSSTIRSTTNSLFFNNTFGMTFGTSNCAKHDIVKNDKKDIHFVESNQEILALEMAEGSGNYLSALGRTLGCTDHALKDFGRATQERYENIFPTSNVKAREVLDHIKSVLKSDSLLAIQCGQLS